MNSDAIGKSRLYFLQRISRRSQVNRLAVDQIVRLISGLEILDDNCINKGGIDETHFCSFIVAINVW